MAIFYYFSVGLFLVLCFLLCSVVLMQESKSTGLGASFGGDSSESVFGTATADVLKKITGWLVFIFLVGCVVLSLWTAAMAPAAKRTPVMIEEEA